MTEWVISLHHPFSSSDKYMLTSAGRILWQQTSGLQLTIPNDVLTLSDRRYGSGLISVKGATITRQWSLGEQQMTA